MGGEVKLDRDGLKKSKRKDTQMKSKKYDQLKWILNLFDQLSDKNSYKQYRNAVHSLANYASKEVEKIEGKKAGK
ncbi:MAG: hypothetical protein EBR82_81645 [Caulobacteraceae bacterium]|nr:hypothetical protein [Caulobacteraceae bacterium]